MIAKHDFFESQAPRDVALPIHPAVTLEDWVGTVHIAMIDSAMTHEQVDALMQQICADPEALRYFAEACHFHELITSAFMRTSPADFELAELAASPIW